MYVIFILSRKNNYKIKENYGRDKSQLELL